ncbi:MAG: CBS domain-containing protein [Methanomassiliicoccales archaeon]|nr:MAG: CBS domain-containing protein [Methanomassiliicoccales archaeon]
MSSTFLLGLSEGDIQLPMVLSLKNIVGKRIIFGVECWREGMLVKDIMVKDVVVLHPEDTIAEATTKFAENKVSGCPVVDDHGALVGMLSEADILGHLKTQYKKLKMRYPPEIMFGISFQEEMKEREIGLAFHEIGSMKVKELMRRDVVAATTNDTVERVVRLMVRRKINRVPIIKDGKLVGIVTRGDVIGGLYQNENATPKRNS